MGENIVSTTLFIPEDLYKRMCACIGTDSFLSRDFRDWVCSAIEKKCDEEEEREELVSLGKRLIQAVKGN